jgi:hypothetical protein
METVNYAAKYEGLTKDFADGTNSALRRISRKGRYERKGGLICFDQV